MTKIKKNVVFNSLVSKAKRTADVARTRVNVDANRGSSGDRYVVKVKIHALRVFNVQIEAVMMPSSWGRDGVVMET